MSDSIEFDHIAIGVAQLADAAALFAGHLGGRPFEGGPGPGYRGAQWEFASGARLEAIEPAGPPDGFLHRFLDARGPGLHHVTFIVPSLRDAASRATELGYTIVGYQDSHPSWKEAFLHPKQALGIVVQMAEKGPPYEGEWSARFPFPTVAESPALPARIVGVRLAVRDAEAARRQWGTLLLGREEMREGLLLFTWPRSPLRVAVQISPGDPEGPVGVEVDAGGAPGITDAQFATGLRLVNV